MRSFALCTGSSGNCFYVEGKDGTSFLVDLGLSFTRTKEILKEKDIEIDEIDAIFITHEHTDHVAGLETFVKNVSCPIYLTRGTLSVIKEKYENYMPVRHHENFSISEIKIFVIDRPHDSKEGVSFIFDDSDKKLGIFTDLGHVTDEMKHALNNLDLIYFETNYCEEHINNNGKNLNDNYLNRLMSDVGHLSLQEGCEVLRQVTKDSQKIVLSHISENTNTYENAYSRVKKELDSAGKFPELLVGFHGEATEWLE